MDQGAGGCRCDGSGKFYTALNDELLAYAEKQFQLGERQPDGATLREHYQSLERQSGYTHELLEEPDCLMLEYVWGYFLSLDKRRKGVEAITNLELFMWAQLHGVELTPIEVDLLDELESMRLAHQKGRAG